VRAGKLPARLTLAPACGGVCQQLAHCSGELQRLAAGDDAGAGQRHEFTRTHIGRDDYRTAHGHGFGHDDAEILRVRGQHEHFGLRIQRPLVLIAGGPHEQHPLGDTQFPCQGFKLALIALIIIARDDQRQVRHRLPGAYQPIETLLPADPAEEQRVARRQSLERPLAQ